MVKYGAAVGLLLIVLAFAPGADLCASRLFYADGHFLGNGRIGFFARDVARLAPLLLFGVVALLYIARRLGWIAARRAPDGRSMLFLALSLALGPGLLVNGVFKTHVHRPRPAQVQQFGGTLDFQPYYRREGGCSRNCSFPSGEAAAAFWTVAPASLAPLPWQPALMAAALLFGVATGLLRMASGGHFLSDVLGAGFLMLIVIAGTRRLLRTNHKPVIRGTDKGIWRRIHLIPYTVTIAGTEVVPDFRAKVLRPELPGILNWALAGLKDYLTNGLRPPPCVVEATDRYRADMDIVARWIDERCERASKARTLLKSLTTDFNDWAIGAGEIRKPWIGRTLSERLQELGLGKTEGGKKHNVAVIEGLELKG